MHESFPVLGRQTVSLNWTVLMRLEKTNQAGNDLKDLSLAYG